MSFQTLTPNGINIMPNDLQYSALKYHPIDVDA